MPLGNGSISLQHRDHPTPAPLPECGDLALEGASWAKLIAVMFYDRVKW